MKTGSDHENRWHFLAWTCLHPWPIVCSFVTNYSCDWRLCFLPEWQDNDQSCLYKIVAMIFFLYLLPTFLFRWVEIPTSKSWVEIPCIGCKNDCNASYVHDVWLLKIECFLNSYYPIERKLSQLKTINQTVLKVLSIFSPNHFASKMGLTTIKKWCSHVLDSIIRDWWILRNVRSHQ
jgi:hypothetical protein